MNIREILHRNFSLFSDKFREGLIENYSKDKKSFLKALLNKIDFYKQKTVVDSEPEILEMYKSTNKRNTKK